MNEFDEAESAKKPASGCFIKVNKTYTIPWWCKIIAYLLSFACMFVSIFFIVIKGIEFGDEKVRKWITSLLVSFLTSVLLTQPIQVNTVSDYLPVDFVLNINSLLEKVMLVALFFVLILRKYNESDDFENDHEDDGKAINKSFKSDSVSFLCFRFLFSSQTQLITIYSSQTC